MKFLMFINLILGFQMAQAEWKIDLSRRQADLKKMDMEDLAAQEANKSLAEQVFEKEQPKEEVVIAATDKGFIPSVLRLKKDQPYKITVVNVNKNKKNVSFMLDAFAEHHGTYFGETVSFTVKPQKEGLFQFYCPEAEFIGKLLVQGADENLQAVPPVQVRQPAQSDVSAEPTIIRGGDE